MIDLQKIGRDNYERVYDLRVTKDQRRFVAPNSWSLAEAAYGGNEMHPLVICADSEPVGFLMYGFYPAADDYPADGWWLAQLMIDEHFQGHGFARTALRMMLKQLHAQRPELNELLAALDPRNAAAIHVYESVGFEKIDRTTGGSDVYILYL